MAGLPFYSLLGGRRQTSLPLYHSITCVEPDEVACIARDARAQGIAQFQAKLGASGDWNCGASSLDATRVGRAMADLDIMLEQALRDLCDRHRVLLIFDETVTGFRLAYGGAQERYGVMPDICTLGKVIGGGFPLASLGARAEIMAHFEKSAVGADNWLMQLGTLSGNPVAAAAGLKTMEVLGRPGQYDRLRALGQSLMDMQSRALGEAGIAHRVCGDPTLFDIYFTDKACIDYRSARHRDPKLNEAWNAALRRHGVFKSPGKIYPSLALTEADLELTGEAIARAVETVSAA